MAYALGHLTWAQLYVVAFGSGVLSVFFYVAYGGFFQTIVEREDYVAANSLIARQPRLLVPRRHQHRRHPRSGRCAGRTRSRSTRCPFSGRRIFLGRIHADDPPAAPESTGGILAGARWIRGNAIIRAELLGVATLNFFNFIYFALFLLYATRELHVQPAALGIVLGVASVGTLFGSVITGRVSRRLGVGPAFLIGCFLFPAPLILVPAAGGPHWFVLLCLFTAEFFSGIGLMLLDILAGSISAGHHPANAALTRRRCVHGREHTACGRWELRSAACSGLRSASGRPCGSRRSAHCPACCSCSPRRSDPCTTCRRKPRND